MDPQEAALTIDRIEELRRETRRKSRGGPEDLWVPILLFGVLMLFTPLIKRTAGGPAVGIYWALVGPLGAMVCGWYYRRRELNMGLEVPPLPYVVVSAAIVVGALALGWIGGASGSELAWMGPLLIVSGGYVLFAWLDRRPFLGALAIALAVVVVALATSGLEADTASLVATLTYGGVLLATGFFLLARAKREG